MPTPISSRTRLMLLYATCAAWVPMMYSLRIEAAIPSHYHHVIVQPGQTLWSLATQERNNNDMSIRVDTLIAVNHLHTPSLQAGQQLLLPTK